MNAFNLIRRLYEITTGKRKSQDTDASRIPVFGYDTTGRRLPTELERLVEGDEVEVKKIRSKAGKKKSHRK